MWKNVYVIFILHGKMGQSAPPISMGQSAPGRFAPWPHYSDLHIYKCSYNGLSTDVIGPGSGKGVWVFWGWGGWGRRGLVGGTVGRRGGGGGGGVQRVLTHIFNGGRG